MKLQKAKAKGTNVSILDVYKHTKTKGHDGVTWLSPENQRTAVCKFLISNILLKILNNVRMQ